MKKKMRMEERKAGVMPWSRGEQEDLYTMEGLTRGRNTAGQL